nr:MAG TPA: hypothetical protein [Caudoviricetes sp.]
MRMIRISFATCWMVWRPFPIHSGVRGCWSMMVPVAVPAVPNDCSWGGLVSTSPKCCCCNCRTRWIRCVRWLFPIGAGRRSALSRFSRPVSMPCLVMSTMWMFRRRRVWLIIWPGPVVVSAADFAGFCFCPCFRGVFSLFSSPWIHGRFF